MGVRIVLAEKEPIGLALRRFKKALERNNLIRDVRRKESFVKQTQIRRAKQFKKRFKSRKATLLGKKDGKLRVDSFADAVAEFWKRTGKP
jgi:small subunit ribosomal protein S21